MRLINQYTPAQMGYRPPNQKKPPVIKVVWLGKNPEYMYAKMFRNPQQAQQFANSLDDVMIYRLEAQKGKDFKWRLMPFGESKEFIKGVKMRRKLKDKKFSNVGGEIRPSIVAEYQKSQGVRLFDVFVIAPVLIYAGTRQELPAWLRYSLIGIGVATAWYNGRNFLVNRKLATEKK